MAARTKQSGVRSTKSVVPSVLKLPRIEPGESAAEALRLMRDGALSGVAMIADGQCWLYEAAQVVVALADNPSARLADVPSTAVLTPSADAGVGSPAARFLFVRSSSTKRTAGSLTAGAPKVTYEVDPDLIRALAASPKDCYCRIDLKPVTGGRTGADCPDGHQRSVRCV